MDNVRKYKLEDLNLKHMFRIDKDGQWQTHYVCQNCGYVMSNRMWTIKSPIVGVQLYFLEECSECEQKKEITIDDESKFLINGWDTISLRFIKTSKWYNPYSWGNGYWELNNLSYENNNIEGESI